MKEKNQSLIRSRPIFPVCETVGLMLKYFIELRLPGGKTGLLYYNFFHLNQYMCGVHVAPWTPQVKKILDDCSLSYLKRKHHLVERSEDQFMQKLQSVLRSMPVCDLYVELKPEFKLEKLLSI